MASRAHPVLPSEALEEIFLHVASPADLARASAACVSFRGLIADHSFLRRYRSIHPPLLLGFASFSSFHPVEAPNPNAAVASFFHPVKAPNPSADVARAVALTADFSFDDLPFPTTAWRHSHLCDIRNGRVLIEFLREETGLASRDFEYWVFVVCDPLSRRYVMLPPITDDLLASVDLDLESQIIVDSGASFIPSGVIEEDTSFSVIHWRQYDTTLGVSVFSSVSGCWSLGMSTNCNDLGLNELELKQVSGQCVNDCFYWKLDHMSMLIKLDMSTMHFCTVDLPHNHDEREIVIVELGESKVAMFNLTYGGTSVDYYTFSQNDSEKSHEWHMMSSIPLPAHYTIIYYIDYSPVEGYIFIQCVQDGEGAHYSAVFSLELKSLNIERIRGTSHNGAAYAYPYFGFPPSMSTRRI